MRSVLILLLVFFTELTHASIIIPMYSTETNEKIGTIKADDTIYGLLLTPHLRHLPPGVHGFHIHECPSCEDHGWAAGGHLDPKKTYLHHGPYNGDGHLGDLPVLIVNCNGLATLPVLAPRLKLDLIEGRALIIHEGGDNYSDKPVKSGGGGERIACGEIGYAH